MTFPRSHGKLMPEVILCLTSKTDFIWSNIRPGRKVPVNVFAKVCEFYYSVGRSVAFNKEKP